jgi:transcriptional regulator with XRE-family HTH domain
MELDYKAIGKRIKIARIKEDLTQEQLADTVSLSVSHLSNIETGTTKVSLSALVRIANALSVSVDNFLADNLFSARPQLENDLQQVLSKCSPYELHVVIGVCKATLETLRANERFLNLP